MEDKGIHRRIMEVIGDYDPIMKSMPAKYTNILGNAASQMEKLGIDNFGYGKIDKQGRLFTFSTNPLWKILAHGVNKNFSTLIQNHYSSELVYIMDNNLRFVTRSKDKLDTEYLKTLNEIKANNSLVLYKFRKDSIEILTLVVDDGKDKDILFNNADFSRV